MGRKTRGSDMAIPFRDPNREKRRVPVPRQPKGPAQTVLRYGAGLSSLPYLLVLFLVQSRYPGGALFLLCAAIGPLAAATFFAAFLRARSRDDRLICQTG